jgi:uncharacterized protein YebE (UPF0316 family)
MFKLFQELLTNPWYAAILVFFTQILMLYFRTINIFYTTKINMFGAIWSSNANAVMWLMSMTIGMNSMINGQWQPIVMYLLGGSLGTYWGIKKEQKQNGV